MRVRVAGWWDTLRGSYWFVPAVMALLATGAAVGMVQLDRWLGHEVAQQLGWLYTGGPEGARGVLATIAGSMITVAGVAFSVVVVALSLASSQFGPRVLTAFMRDPGHQVVLGTFVAAFVYCLMVLRSVRGGDEAGLFVPHASVTVAVAFALAGLGVLIYFVHHAAVSIQAATVIASVTDDLHDGISRVLREAAHRHPAAEGGAGEEEWAGAVAVRALREGYVQTVDEDALAGAARDHGARVRVTRRVGTFVTPGDELARVRGAAGGGEALAGRVRAAFDVGARRTTVQDVEFSVRQLTEIGVRALSAAVNDPFTAEECVDRLGGALARALELPPSPRVVVDAHGEPRVWTETVTFATMAAEALDPVRHYAASSPSVLLRLLGVLLRLAERADDAGAREVVRSHAGAVMRAAERGLTEPRDLAAVRARHDAVMRALG